VDDSWRLFDNLDGEVLAADQAHLVPDVTDPNAELWWRPVAVVDTGGRT
jgi:hypothetical protein